MGACQGGLQEALCGLLFWHSLDVHPARGHGAGIFLCIPDRHEVHASGTGSLCDMADPGHHTLVLLFRCHKRHDRLHVGVQLSGKEDGLPGGAPSGHKAFILPFRAFLLCGHHALRFFDKRVHAHGKLDPDILLFLCCGSAGAGPWLPHQCDKCFFQRYDPDSGHSPAVRHVACPHHVLGGHVHG